MLVSAVMNYDGGSHSWHIREVIANDVGVDTTEAQVTKPPTGRTG